MKKWNWLVTLFSAALIVVTVYQSILVGATTEKVTDGSLVRIAGTWSDVTSDESGQKYITCNYQVPPNESSTDAYLYMESYWTDFEVLDNGQSRYIHFDVEADGYAHLVSLGRLNRGERISITFKIESENNITLLKKSLFYIGDQSGIYNKVLYSNLYAFIYSLLSGVLGAAMLVMSYTLAHIRSEGQAFKSLGALGAFILTTGIWVLTDSQLLLLVTGRTAIISQVSFLSFYIMPIFLLRFTRQMMELKQRTYMVLVGFYILLLDAYTLNCIFGVCNSTLLLTVEHLLSTVTIFTIMGGALKQLKKSHDAKLVRVLIGYACYSVGSLVGLALFYARPFSGYSQAYALGTAGFVICLFDAGSREMYDQLAENVSLQLRAKLAYLDTMTETGNRAAFHDRQLEDAELPESIAYLMVDINNLKTTNDTLGHTAGDQIIIRTAQCLKEAAGQYARCYRIGGDEFVACFRGVSEEEVYDRIARLYDLVEKDNDGKRLKLSVAAGGAWTDAPILTRDLDKLLRQADAAMYKEKRRMKGSQRR